MQKKTKNKNSSQKINNGYPWLLLPPVTEENSLWRGVFIWLLFEDFFPLVLQNCIYLDLQY